MIRSYEVLPNYIGYNYWIFYVYTRGHNAVDLDLLGINSADLNDLAEFLTNTNVLLNFIQQIYISHINKESHTTISDHWPF